MWCAVEQVMEVAVPPVWLPCVHVGGIEGGEGLCEVVLGTMMMGGCMGGCIPGGIREVTWGH